MLCFAVGVGLGVGITYFYSNSTGVEQKTRCLKRKLKKIEKDMENALDKLKPEQLQKYKKELETSYKELMNKVDSLTIKDIKDKASNALNSIKEHIKFLSNKISSLMTTEENN